MGDVRDVEPRLGTQDFGVCDVRRDLGAAGDHDVERPLRVKLGHALGCGSGLQRLDVRALARLGDFHAGHVSYPVKQPRLRDVGLEKYADFGARAG